MPAGRAAVPAVTDNREVVHTGTEAVAVPEVVEHGPDLIARYEDGPFARLADQVLMVVIDGQVPLARLSAEDHVVNDADA